MGLYAMLWRLLPATLLCLACVACDSAPRDTQQRDVSLDDDLSGFLPKNPDLNVIIVSFDALRADALGTYGNPLDVSPRIDAFASRSLVLEQAYSAARATPTSFASAFTGLYPFKSFVKSSLIVTPTLGNVFQNAGYRTAGFFNNVQLVAERNFGQGFEEFYVHRPHDDEHFFEVPERWLRENRNERMFVWIHFISPHSPYDRREMAAHLYSPDYEGRFQETSGLLRDVFQLEDRGEVARLKELYLGEVFYADTLFGRLESLLEELGLLESSVVVLTSDHGEEFGEHGALSHRQLHEEVIRLPLIVYHPDVRIGHRTRTPYLNVDLLPTLASIVDIEYPSELDGVDLAREHRSQRALLSSAMTGGPWRSMGVRVRNHKLILTCPPREQKVELFDLETDPLERVNLVRDRPRIARRLATRMSVQAGGAPCDAILNAVKGVSMVEGLDQETIEQLTALGYAQ